CSSVCICGRLFSARNFCQFCGFRGRIGKRAAWVWQDAIPSYDVSVGGSSPPETSARSVASVGG
uniref:hypothetical protein n=1 Tax=Leyella stercorea TaxID=363265 RepID=UPI003FF0A836